MAWAIIFARWRQCALSSMVPWPTPACPQIASQSVWSGFSHFFMVHWCSQCTQTDTHHEMCSNRLHVWDACDIHTQPFNGPLSGTTQVSRYHKGKTNLDFTGARDSEWHWNRLGNMQVWTSLQKDNHDSTSPLSFYRLDALPATQPTVSKPWRHTGCMWCDRKNQKTANALWHHSRCRRWVTTVRRDAASHLAADWWSFRCSPNRDVAGLCLASATLPCFKHIQSGNNSSNSFPGQPG